MEFLIKSIQQVYSNIIKKKREKKEEFPKLIFIGEKPWNNYLIPISKEPIDRDIKIMMEYYNCKTIRENVFNYVSFGRK